MSGAPAKHRTGLGRNGIALNMRIVKKSGRDGGRLLLACRLSTVLSRARRGFTGVLAFGFGICVLYQLVG